MRSSICCVRYTKTYNITLTEKRMSPLKKFEAIPNFRGQNGERESHHIPIQDAIYCMHKAPGQTDISDKKFSSDHVC